MDKNRKAQAAMEFLMTYGWAILVVLVAIGALAYFGVLSPEKLIPDKCVISPGSGVSCDDYGAVAAGATTNAVNVRLKNVGADTITISKVSIETPSCSDEAAQNITAGSTGTFGIDCVAPTSKGKIRTTLNVVFKKADGGVEKTVSGDLVVTVPAAAA